MDSSWNLYQSQPSFVLGFHGAETQTVEALIAEPTKHLKQSAGRYEWLGHGIYFWENDPLRAYEWATAGNAKSKIKEPDSGSKVAIANRPLSTQSSRPLS